MVTVDPDVDERKVHVIDVAVGLAFTKQEICWFEPVITLYEDWVMVTVGKPRKEKIDHLCGMLLSGLTYNYLMKSTHKKRV